MIEEKSLLGSGVVQAGASLVLAAVTAAVIAVSAWTDTEVAARLAITGAVLFTIALVFGSARFVGATTVLVLGAALMASASAGDPAWIRSIVLGTVWYVAVELAWDAIERRDRARRSTALEYRRAYEVATVVAISLAVTVTGFAASGLALERTFVAQGVIVLAVLAALGFVIRHITETSPAVEDEQ